MNLLLTRKAALLQARVRWLVHHKSPQAEMPDLQTLAVLEHDVPASVAEAAARKLVPENPLAFMAEEFDRLTASVRRTHEQFQQKVAQLETLEKTFGSPAERSLDADRLTQARKSLPQLPSEIQALGTDLRASHPDYLRETGELAEDVLEICQREQLEIATLRRQLSGLLQKDGETVKGLATRAATLTQRLQQLAEFHHDARKILDAVARHLEAENPFSAQTDLEKLRPFRDVDLSAMSAELSKQLSLIDDCAKWWSALVTRLQEALDAHRRGGVLARGHQALQQQVRECEEFFEKDRARISELKGQLRERLQANFDAKIRQFAEQKAAVEAVIKTARWRRQAAVVVAALAVVLIGFWIYRHHQISRKEFVEKSLAMGRDCCNRQEWEQAVVHLEKAVASDSRNAAAWRFLGVAYHRTGKHPAAIEALGRALQQDPSAADGWLELGDAYLDQENIGKAIEAYQRATEQDGGGAGWAELGLAYMKQNDLQKAADAFEKQVSLRPKSKAAWLMLGNARVEQGRWEDTWRAIEKARTLPSPSKEEDAACLKIAEQINACLDAACQEALARFQRHADAKEWEPAKRAAEEALRIKPSDSKARECRERAGREIAFREGMERVQSLAQARRWTDAQAAVGEVLRLKPDAAEARRLQSTIDTATRETRRQEAIERVRALTQAKQWAEAQAVVTVALESEPGDAELLKLQSVIHAARKDQEYQTMLTRAEKFLNEKQYAAALQSVEESLAARPGDRKAVALKQAAETAEKDLRDRKVRDAEVEARYQAAIREAESFANQTRYRQALGAAQKALALRPNDPRATELLGQARESFKRVLDAIPVLDPKKMVHDCIGEGSASNAFNNRYKGKTIRYTGKVGRINKEEKLVVFRGGGLLLNWDVQSSLAPEFQDRLSSLKENEELSVAAELDAFKSSFMGVGGESIRLKNAVILDPGLFVPNFLDQPR
ncbi:MAG: tetratricopeptide repeat protein [Verrucomicrobia bacterium]|nr:tetratricopeptide repeat protein [Verrucomicrobiota bacterium]